MQTDNLFTSISSPILQYDPGIELEIAVLIAEIERHPAIVDQYPVRWLALTLLGQDTAMQGKMLMIPGGPAVLTHAQLALARLEAIVQDDIEIIIADRRYTWINELVRETVQKPRQQQTLSDRIDRLLIHRYWGVPIFLALMWVVFKLTADVAAPYVDWIDGVISGPITRGVMALMRAIALDGSWIESLFVDGIIAGVGGVLVFIPVLMSLYLALAVMEDSGYMARAAFVMDRLMNKIGLHGKSFLPLLVGFGCSVPAIYATRTLENEKDRLLTGLLVPFMSCGARLPVYILFSAIFFPDHAGLVIFGLYLLGILTAVTIGMILRKTIFPANELSTFVMELPPYRMPSWRSIWFHMWQRTQSFIKNAWTVILAASVVIWLFMAIPVRGEGRFAVTQLDDSAFAVVAKGVAPVLKPLGFGNWESSSALVTGLVAKEVVVSTMAQIYGLEDEAENEPVSLVTELNFIASSFGRATLDTLQEIPAIVGIPTAVRAEESTNPTFFHEIQQSFQQSSGGYGALAGLAFMVFVLIYTPCLVTVAAEKQEFGVKWMWVSVIGQLVLAWLMAFLIFQGGKLLLG